MSSRRLAVSRSGFLLSAALALWTLSPQAALPAGPSASASASTATDLFWSAIGQMGIVLRSIGNLSESGGGGEVWIAELATGHAHRINTPAPLAWPVLAPDGRTIFALRAGQLVRLSIEGGTAAPVARGVRWRKLLGVGADNTVLGFVADGAQVRAALLTPTGKVRMLPAPKTDTQRSQIALLLQENRSYADGFDLLVKRSTHGGLGYDVALVTGTRAKDVTDCGDDRCGQASLSPDRRQLIYVRSTIP